MQGTRGGRGLDPLRLPRHGASWEWTGFEGNPTPCDPGVTKRNGVLTWMSHANNPISFLLQRVNFTSLFFDPPVVMLTPKRSYYGSNVSSQGSACDAMTAWVEVRILNSSQNHRVVCYSWCSYSVSIVGVVDQYFPKYDLLFLCSMPAHHIFSIWINYKVPAHSIIKSNETYQWHSDKSSQPITTA